MTVPRIFATQPAGNVPSSYLDEDFAAVLSQSTNVLGDLSIANYGAVGGGATDNSAFINSAIAAALAAGVGILIPAGVYRCNSALTVAIPAAHTFSIKGSGATILFPNGSGIAVTYGSAFSSLAVTGLQFTTSLAGTGSAISLTQTVSNANPAVSGITEFISCIFAGSDGFSQTNYWSTCVAITNVANVTFTNCNFQGPNSAAGKGVTLVGDLTHTTYGVAYQFVACNFNSLSLGLEYGSYIQGVTVIGGNMSNGTTGIQSPAAQTGVLQGLQVVGTQFGVAGTTVDLQTVISGVTLAANIVEVFSSQTGFKIKSGGASIVGNTFNGQGGTNHDSNIGIEIVSGGNIGVDLNLLGALQTGVKIDSGVTNTRVGGGNSYAVVGTAVSNAGTNCFAGYQQLGDQNNNWQTYLGAIPFAANAAGVTVIGEGTAGANALLLSAADSYYRNTNHHFQNIAGSIEALLVTSTAVTFGVDRGEAYINQTSGAGASTGTLLNAPTGGNPTHWLKIFINGNPFCIPCWPG